jgi:hypothetical protein
MPAGRRFPLYRCPRPTIASERGTGKPARSTAPLILRAPLVRTSRRVGVVTMTLELSQHRAL